jgi:type I restriction enzyme S subunit
MSEWLEIQLNDLINVKHGYAFSGAGITTEETENILVTPGNFYIGGGFKSGKFKYFNGEYPDSYILKDGDIVVTMTDLSKDGDTLGYGAKIPRIKNKKLLHNQRIGLVQILSEEIEKDFLYWLLRTSDYQGFIHGAATGTSVKHTSPTTIKQYKFLLPELPEQKAIAAVLSSLDDKIDLLHRQHKTLEAMAETLFKQWFVVEAREDWEEFKLKSIVHHVKPGTNYQPKRLENGIPFLNVRNLKNGFLDLSDVTYISEEEYIRVHKAWQPEENDVLISRIGTLGIVAVISKRDLPVAVHYNMINIKAKSTSYQFIYFILKSNYFRELYFSNIRQSVQEYVAIEDVENINLKLPINSHFFKEKEKTFNQLYSKISINESQIQTLETLRDTLLPKLMSGEVRVNLD